jgi:hypothetical protein
MDLTFTVRVLKETRGRLKANVAQLLLMTIMRKHTNEYDYSEDENSTSTCVCLERCYCGSKGSEVDGDKVCYMFTYHYQNSEQIHGSDTRVTLEEYRLVYSLAGLLRHDSDK